MENSNFLYDFNNGYGWFVDIESQEKSNPTRYKYNLYNPNLPTIPEETKKNNLNKIYDDGEDERGEKPNKTHSLGFICCIISIIMLYIYFL